jgi:putative transposase
LKAAVEQVREEYAFSQRRACGLVTMAVSSYRYQSRRSDEPLRTRLVELAREKPRFGYRRLHVLLGRSGEHVNHKRVHRVYREAGLMIRRKKRKHCARVGQPLRVWTAANQEWALDFLHDAVECGRAIRVLSVVDAYTRECLALEVDTSFASRRVTRVLEGIVAERGQPKAIRCDNGPELTSRHFLAWCVERQIELVHIQPGKPTQNAHVESFHGRLREECLAVRTCSMRGARSRRGRSNTTKSARTAVWDTARRKSLRRRRQRASTQLSERQGTQTPSLAPRAPPSRLTPAMEQQ